MSARKGKPKKGVLPMTITFEYMGETHTMHCGEMGSYFGVSYDKIKRRKRMGWSDQAIANEAAEQGRHKPRGDILYGRFLRTRLV